MTWERIRVKASEKVDKTVEFARAHWKGILVTMGLTALTGYVLSKNGTEAEGNYGIIDEYDQLGSNIEQLSEKRSLESHGSYHWIEEGHQVREHKRHYTDGKEVIIEEYTKITGAKSNGSNQSGDNSSE